MQSATIVVIMGLNEDPRKECLGLREIVETLAYRYPLFPVFASYKSSDEEIDTLLAPFDSPDHPMILTGHSLGGGQAHATAMRRLGRGRRVDAVGIWEPVPENDAFNGAYRFPTLSGVKHQMSMRVAGKFPFSWGRRFADNTLNRDLKRRSVGIIAIDHADMCKWPEVRQWYADTTEALCQVEAPVPGEPVMLSTAAPKKKRNKKPKRG